MSIADPFAFELFSCREHMKRIIMLFNRASQGSGRKNTKVLKYAFIKKKLQYHKELLCINSNFSNGTVLCCCGWRLCLYKG